MMGNWHRVIEPILDRSSDLQIKSKWGKLTKSFFELIENLTLVDFWRHKYGLARDYTFYSERFKSFSRIDMIWILLNLANKIIKVNISPKTFSDHNPVSIITKLSSRSFRWRLNEAILKREDLLEECKKRLDEFFEINLNNEVDIGTVWDTSKAYMRGLFIHLN